MFHCGRFAGATLSLLAVVLTVHGACSTCSAFAPQQRSYPSPDRCFQGPLAPTDRTPQITDSSICVTSSRLFGSAASDGISGVGSSVAQTFLANQEESGRVLTKHDQKWWKRFGELEEYKKEYGGCNVPINYAANLSLAKWVMNQRAAYERFVDSNWKKSSGISAERIDALNNIGFEWRLRNRPEWDERYDELVAYKQTHGDTLVPMTAISDATNKYYGLAQWVMVQRKQYHLRQEGKHSHLTNDRLKKLNRSGFVWKASDAAWEKHCAELKEFKANHGHTDVPKGSENKELYSWVGIQRQHYKYFQKGKPSFITKERIEKLESIGFEWASRRTHRWKIRFGELRDFYNKNAIGPIPSKEVALYRWARIQKQQYDKYINGKKTNMDEGRIKDLEIIGFFDVYGK